MPDFRPTATIETLRQRDAIIRRIREFFEWRDFLHVETPLLSRDTVIDRYLFPVEVSSVGLLPSAGVSDPAPMYLQTSPEFAMKRLLAAGHTSIYQICKAFRGGGERGAKHNPEFTMLEWYRTGDDMNAGISLLSEFAESMLGGGPAKRMTYRDAFGQFAGIDPFTATLDDFLAVCRSHNINVVADGQAMDRDNWLHLIMSEVVESQLGQTAPTILYHYPASQAALARVINGAPALAERFELYYRGIELANGYHELCDAGEFALRNRNVNTQRVADGSSILPTESYLAAAMKSGLPQCSGVALGVDRLIMLLLSAEKIDQAIAFPIDRA